jgi:hypothetical protein
VSGSKAELIARIAVNSHCQLSSLFFFFLPFLSLPFRFRTPIILVSLAVPQDCIVNKPLPRCQSCFIGRLKRKNNGELYCPGAYALS